MDGGEAPIIPCGHVELSDRGSAWPHVQGGTVFQLQTFVDDFGGTIAHWTSLYGAVRHANRYRRAGSPSRYSKRQPGALGVRDETTILRSINEIDVAAWKVLGKSVGHDMVSRP